MGNSRASTSGTGNKYGSHAFLFLTTNLTKRGTGAALTTILIMGKNFTKFLSGLCIAILSMLTLSSCKSEKSAISFGFACSEDVLEYVEPKVTYFNNNGEKVERNLTREDFKVETSDTADKYVWTTTINYEDGDVENSCVITFNQRKPVAEEKQHYFYLAELKGNGCYEKKSSGFGSIEITQGVNLTLSFSHPSIRTEEQFKKDIETLISRSLSLKIRLDSNGNVYME